MERSWGYWYLRSQLVKAQLTGAAFLEDDHHEETYQKRREDTNALFPLQVRGNASKANGTLPRKWLYCLSSNHALYDILAWSRQRPWTSLSQGPPESCWQMLEPTQLSTKVKQERHVLVPDNFLYCQEQVTMKSKPLRSWELSGLLDKLSPSQPSFISGCLFLAVHLTSDNRMKNSHWKWWILWHVTTVGNIW